jgi:hypothetical protein
LQAAFKEGGKKGVDLQASSGNLLRCACMHQVTDKYEEHNLKGVITIYRACLAYAVQGVAAMGGVCFFNLAVDTPNGDMALLEKVGARHFLVGSTS